MKTCLFSLSYLDGVDKSDSSRLERNIKFLNYYWPLREKLGFSSIILSDNCSSVRNLGHLVDRAPTRVTIQDADYDRRLSTDSPIRIYRFEEHLSFGQTFPKEDPRSSFDYPYCWRGFETIGDLFSELGFEKVLFIDTDCFVLSQNLADYIRSTKYGWTSLWCPKYSFPESSMQIILPESFEPFRTRGWETHVGERMESTLPFTRIEKRMVADRFGEDRVPVRDDMDYYGQAPVDIEMKFRG